ncbi:hypothetical protein D3C84_1033640 [compost metagenome]
MLLENFARADEVMPPDKIIDNVLSDPYSRVNGPYERIELHRKESPKTRVGASILQKNRAKLQRVSEMLDIVDAAFSPIQQRS